MMRTSAQPLGRWQDWAVVLLLTVAMFFSFVDRFVLSLLIEPIKGDLHLSDAQLGLLNGIAFGLFYAFIGVPFGWLADRWSRKYTIILGMGLWTVATASCGFATAFGPLLAARVLVGAGEAGLQPASYGILHDRFPKERLGSAISFLQIGGMLGAGGAMLVAGAVYTFLGTGHGNALPLIGAMRPWQQTFVIMAAPSLLLLPLIALLRDEGMGGKPAGDRVSAQRQSLLAALGGQPVVYALLFLAASGLLVVTYALLNWTPAIMGREFGWAPGRVGATYGAAILLAGPAGLIFGGLLADWLYRRNVAFAHPLVLVVAAGLGLPLAILLPWLTTPWSVIAVAAFLQMAMALPLGVAPAYIQLITPEAARSQVSAVYHLVMNVVAFGIGTSLIGLLSAHNVSPGGLRQSVATVVIGSLVITLAFALALCRLVARRTETAGKGL